MLLIAIVDDEDYICSLVEELLHSILHKYQLAAEIEIFNSGDRFQQHLSNGKYYDVVFLDIELGKISGLDVSQMLRTSLGNEATQIIYISGKTEYAIDVFDYDPIYFLAKPLTEEMVEKAFKKIIRKLNIKAEAFTYKVGAHTFKIPIKDIVYFENQGRKITIHFQNKTDHFYGSLDKVRNQLEKYHFILIHKSFLINPLHVRSFAYDSVMMSDSAVLQIAQLKRKDVRKQLLELELSEGGEA